MTVWPSGLRRWLKAPVRKGVGSNPTAVTDVFLFVVQKRFFDLILRARAGKVAGVFALLLQLGGGFFEFLVTRSRLLRAKQQDSLAEWSKALAPGASPQGRGLEPHSCPCAFVSFWLARWKASRSPAHFEWQQGAPIFTRMGALAQAQKYAHSLSCNVFRYRWRPPARVSSYKPRLQHCSVLLLRQ